jgi:amino acid transporter
MYGIVFILLGNLSGNAIAFGEYAMLAGGYSDQNGNLTASHGSVVGLAVAMLTVVVLVHMFSRRGGILLNNGFAIFKVMIFLVILILGFAVRGGANFNKTQPPPPKIGNENFDTKTSFSEATNGVSNYTTSLLYVMYTYSGFEQPFYVCLHLVPPLIRYR